MNVERLQTLTQSYARLRIALVGDFCLDRYLEIDPGRAEISIETGLPVHNVALVRCQPGAAGTILNNLVALGVRQIFPVGFAGTDGEGFELQRALKSLPGVRLDHFVITPDRATFTYCKPLVIEPGQPPRELNRLDTKNWTPTPESIRRAFSLSIEQLAPNVDAFIVLDQVDVAHTGVVTPAVLESISAVAAAYPRLPILADSRRGLRDFPCVDYKMNLREFATLRSLAPDASWTHAELRQQATQLAQKIARRVFITLAEDGILGAQPDGTTTHQPALPTRGPIDIVGAGDAVTANLATALAAGASLQEAIGLANAAASIVIHQLGTTGTATIAQLQEILLNDGPGRDVENIGQDE